MTVFSTEGENTAPVILSDNCKRCTLINAGLRRP